MYVYAFRKEAYIYSALALLRVAGSMQKSTEVMKIMDNAVKLPQIRDAIMTMGAEMMKVCTFFLCLLSNHIRIYILLVVAHYFLSSGNLLKFLIDYRLDLLRK